MKFDQSNTSCVFVSLPPFASVGGRARAVRSRCLVRRPRLTSDVRDNRVPSRWKLRKLSSQEHQEESWPSSLSIVFQGFHSSQFPRVLDFSKKITKPGHR